MRLGTVPQAVASGMAVLLISACSAGIGIGAEPLTQAQAAQRTYCQWSYERGRKVVAFGNDVQQWRVKVRGTGTIKLGMVQEDALTPPSDRTWIEIALPKGTAEDDIRKVSCKVAGKWMGAETA